MEAGHFVVRTQIEATAASFIHGPALSAPAILTINRKPIWARLNFVETG
jgi:hypothetical protein